MKRPSFMLLNEVPGRGRPKKGKGSTRSGLKSIVSLRVSDDEKKVLETVAEGSGKTVSQMLRSALILWLRHRHGGLPG